MNVTRSTLLRKGYVLTALTVAALLAGSAGSAWAQTIGFSTSRGTLQEGATTATSTEDPLKVTITRTGDFNQDDGISGNNNDDDTSTDQTFEDWVGANSNVEHLQLELVEYDGNISNVRITARSGDDSGTTAPTVTPAVGAAGTAFGFRTQRARSDNVANRIELTIENTTGDPNDWNEETLVLKVVATSALNTHLNENKLSYNRQEFTVTVTDDEPMPVFKFDSNAIQLAKNNEQKVTVGVGVGVGGSGPLPAGMRTALAGLTGDTKNVLLAVEPPDSVGRLIQITKGEGDSAESLPSDGRGGFIVGTIGGTGGVVKTDAMDDGIELTIKALDVSSFRDETISLMLTDGRREAEKTADGGGINEASATTVTILSGEETPTVTFSTESVTIDEGGMETVHILADGEQGDQVGAVAISVSGDATIVLEQGGDRISGGVVQFGDSANAELTIRSLEDVRLEDGEEKMATVTITDASGANIGDPRTLTVTVVGSTAVPVLPLVGQLLLGLLLTASGARLYRRRQQ